MRTPANHQSKANAERPGLGHNLAKFISFPDCDSNGPVAIWLRGRLVGNYQSETAPPLVPFVVNR